MGCASTVRRQEKTDKLSEQTQIEFEEVDNENFEFKEADNSADQAEDETTRSELPMRTSQENSGVASEANNGVISEPPCSEKQEQKQVTQHPILCGVEIQPELPKPILIEKRAESAAKRKVKVKAKPRVYQAKLTDNQLDEDQESSQSAQQSHREQKNSAVRPEIEIDNMNVSIGDEFDL